MYRDCYLEYVTLILRVNVLLFFRSEICRLWFKWCPNSVKINLLVLKRIAGRGQERCLALGGKLIE